ncbi:MAG: hypothetical protein R3B99_21340 [Polyangiales bacterium]|nr:hypothetical protein [Sandaracinus sp.]
MRWCTLLLLVACYRSHGVGDEGVPCPEEPCFDGNACVECGATRRCRSLDLPPDEGCRTLLCDGDEDCEAPRRCSLDDPSYVSCVSE